MSDDKKTDNSEKIVDGHYKISGDPAAQERLLIFSIGKTGELEKKYADVGYADGGIPEDPYKNQGYNATNKNT